MPHPAPFQPGDPVALGFAPTRLTRVDRLLDDLVASGELAAAGLLVARRGQVALERYAGLATRVVARPAGPGTAWLLASITKPVAAAAIMVLVERGLLLLDDPVARLLPDFGASGKEQITVRHLLTHTSGLDESFQERLAWVDAPPGRYLAALYATGLVWPTGSRAAYNNAGFNLLAEIIRVASGEPHTAFIQREILTPAGMTGATLGLAAEQIGERLADVDDFPPDQTRGLIASGSLAGGLVATARDVAAFGQVFLARGRAAAGPLLAPATVAAMLRDHAEGLEEAMADGQWAPAEGRGLAWRLNHRRPTSFCDLASTGAFGHGGATGTLLLIDPTYELVVSFMTNRWGWAGRGRRQVLNAVYAALTD
jgi:serine-type D-Ala-D-Ala carboxypeptidase